jgi:hypothetical protein
MVKVLVPANLDRLGTLLCTLSAKVLKGLTTVLNRNTIHVKIFLFPSVLQPAGEAEFQTAVFDYEYIQVIWTAIRFSSCSSS